RHLPN
ncbi:hypothetical protein D030_1338B, partial [Vibrio parahaemolyticus AQ3810]